MATWTRLAAPQSNSTSRNSWVCVPMGQVSRSSGSLKTARDCLPSRNNRSMTLFVRQWLSAMTSALECLQRFRRSKFNSGAAERIRLERGASFREGKHDLWCCNVPKVSQFGHKLKIRAIKRAQILFLRPELGLWVNFSSR